jgi:ribulose kinase
MLMANQELPEGDAGEDAAMEKRELNNIVKEKQNKSIAQLTRRILADVESAALIVLDDFLGNGQRSHDQFALSAVYLFTMYLGSV